MMLQHTEPCQFARSSFLAESDFWCSKMSLIRTGLPIASSGGSLQTHDLTWPWSEHSFLFPSLLVSSGSEGTAEHTDCWVTSGLQALVLGALVCASDLPGQKSVWGQWHLQLIPGYFRNVFQFFFVGVWKQSSDLAWIEVKIWFLKRLNTWIKHVAGDECTDGSCALRLLQIPNLIQAGPPRLHQSTPFDSCWLFPTVNARWCRSQHRIAKSKFKKDVAICSVHLVKPGLIAMLVPGETASPSKLHEWCVLVEQGGNGGVVIPLLQGTDWFCLRPPKLSSGPTWTPAWSVSAGSCESRRCRLVQVGEKRVCLGWIGWSMMKYDEAVWC